MQTLKQIAATRTIINSETRTEDVAKRILYPRIPGKSEGTLLSHQIEHAHTLDNTLDTRTSVSDVSKPGRGKTFVALWIAKTRHLPIMVFCPKSMINTWYKTATMWGVPIISITNYDMARSSYSSHDVKWYDMRNGFTTVPTVCPWMYKRRLVGQKEEFEFVMDVPFPCIQIIDEEHTGKNTNTQTFSLLKGIKRCSERQGHKILYLSATPIEKKVNLKSILYFLGYVSKPDMNTVNSYFKKTIGTTNMEEIHSYLFNREKSVSAMPDAEYPEGVTNDVKALTYEMDEEATAHITEINAEIMAARRGLARKSHDSAIGCMNHNRMAMEKYKVQKFVDLIVESMDDGWSRVGLFVNFKETLFAVRDKLLEYVDEDEIALIHGEIDNSVCDEEARAYREGEKRIMIATLKKGGQSISFHDTIGGLETMVFISPPTSATDVEQCTGRHFRTKCMSKVVQRIVFTRGDPIEESIRTALSRKLDDILKLTTGRESEIHLGYEDEELYDMCDVEVKNTPANIVHPTQRSRDNMCYPDLSRVPEIVNGSEFFDPVEDIEL